jgi:hypothetical protein
MKRLLTVGVSSAALAAILAGGTLAPASAAASGLAYDSVTRFKMGGDPAGVQPGSFATDFEQASQVRAKEPSGGGGMFGMAKQAMEAAQGAAAIFQNGVAQRHYIAGARERTDDIAQQKATITDCAARTITTLDLAKKTYRVVSMDQPVQTGTPSPSKPQPVPTDDGSKVAIVLTTTSLGPKTISGDPTNGYNLDMKMTTTKPNGESKTTDISMTSYYSNYAEPHLTCPRAESAADRGPAAGAMASYSTAMRALAGNSKDGRFKVSASGPALPAGRLSLFDVFAPKPEAGANEGPKGGFGMVLERGHVRTIADGDPVFSVPSDFTKEP